MQQNITCHGNIDEWQSKRLVWRDGGQNSPLIGNNVLTEISMMYRN